MVEKMIVEFLDKRAIQRVDLDTTVLLPPLCSEEECGVEADPQFQTFDHLHCRSLHENGNGSVGDEPTSDWGVGGIYQSERCLPTHRM